MKRLLLAGIAAAALCGMPALAADMPTKAPFAKAPYDPWTGCYVGANTGAAWAHQDSTWTATSGVPIAPVPRGSMNADGWAYGGQVGCDYRFSNNWVFGIRGMWDGSNIKGTHFVPIPNVGNFPDQFDHVKISSFASATVQLGFLMNPSLMLYGLGGVAWVRDHFTTTDVAAGGLLEDGKQTRTGYDVGAGLAWMFAPNLDLWVEYDHMGFGRRSVLLNSGGLFAGTTDTFTIKQNVDKVLVGINYRFNAGR